MKKIIEKIKNSRLSEVKKQELISILLTFALISTLSGCSDKKIEPNISSNYSITEYLDNVSSLTMLDEYLYKNGFTKLNDKYIEARKSENLNEIKSTLQEIYDLILKGIIIDDLINKGTIKTIEVINRIEIIPYKDNKVLDCNIEYMSKKEKTLPGNIKLTDKEKEHLKFEIKGKAKDDWEKINNVNDFSISTADEAYEECIKYIFNSGNVDLNKGKFTVYADEAKENLWNNKDNLESTGEAKKISNS